LGLGARLGQSLLGADFASFQRGLEIRNRQLEWSLDRASRVLQSQSPSRQRLVLAGVGAGLGLFLTPQLAHAAVESGHHVASSGSMTAWMLGMGLGAGLGLLGMVRTGGPYRSDLHGEILRPLEIGHRILYEDAQRGTRTLQLGRDQELQGNLLPKGSQISLNLERERYSVYLSRDAEIGGIPFPKRSSVELDNQGRPLS